MKQVINEVHVHLGTDIKAWIAYKDVQLMKTESMQILLGTPDALTTEVIEPKAKEIIDAVDRELTGGTLAGKLCWSIAPGRPVGMPFKPFKEGTQFVDNGQRGFVFTCASHQEARFDEILDIAKKH